ncbi:MAG: O-antigen ligase family protein [Flavobacteriales bacterium]
MNFEELKYKANYYVLVLLAFVIPLERKFAPPLIILFLITSIVNHRLKKLSGHKILLFTSLFVLYVFGVFYSEDKALGLNNLAGKFSLLIFPLAIYFSNINFKKQLKPILYSFVDGCFVSGVISLIMSTLTFNFTLDSSSFFYGNSSYFLHPSYLSMYLNFSLLILYFTANLFDNNGLEKRKVWSFFLLLFFSIIILFSASKTGLILLLLIHFSAILYWIVTNKKYVVGGVAIISFIVLGLGVYQYSTTLQNRVNEMLAVVSSGDTSSGTTTAARVEIWNVSAHLIADKPIMGYGTSNEQKALLKVYEREGFSHFAEKKLNAHNQFLQTGIAIGSVGFLVLMLMLFVPLYFSLKKKHYLYGCFILLMVFNFLTEAILERQAGVVFYALFNALFFMSLFDNNSEEKSLKS